MSVGDEIVDVRTLSGKFGTPLDEIQTRDFVSFFNHFINAVPSGEGITSLRFTTSSTSNASVSRNGPDARLSTQASANENASIESNDRGNYAPGTLAIGGIGVELPNGLPTGEQKAWFGFTNGTDGYGAGIDSSSPYVFVDIGGSRTEVSQTNWNIDTLDGSGPNDANPSGLQLNNFETGNIIRFPHLWYGHGELVVSITVVDPDTNQVQRVKVHAFTQENDGMMEQPNVPIKAQVENNGTAASLDLDVRAMHYERLSSEADVRLNGETRRGVDVDTSWEPLISYQKRTNWEQVNVRPVVIAIGSDTDLNMEIQLDTGLNGSSFGAPTHTTSTEHAVDVDTSATGFSSTGERRWIGQVTGGQGSNRQQGTGQLEFNLPSGQIVTLAAKADSSNATVDATIVWGSEF